ncbi:2Fe-2S iron-sulfur cluster binding domain-containing protein [Aquincola sp. S2]|uniref:2Fe-2S iron-sulfur cluster binding domain-containing protein n=1 Tax=Pseudaquabacterium terrae TaxID=2732868 RepID=A0ABX2ERI1_9BURK|nr:2Fe-2S iron-sulfur cluster-binding protein [Aquabacterium terrae]NRF71241.1 2Fe-2S iron-sulfur cluster binding domain-containing protein [Aquabacterium terrae]
MNVDTRPTVSVCVVQTGETYACATDESLLRGMLRLGRRGIPVGCVNGGCGVCKVRIVEGCVHALGPVSRAHVSADEEGAGMTLACRVAPSCALTLEVAGRLVRPFSRALSRSFSSGPAAAVASPQSTL